jgi:hypothetical protein
MLMFMCGYLQCLFQRTTFRNGLTRPWTCKLAWSGTRTQTWTSLTEILQKLRELKGSNILQLKMINGLWNVSGCGNPKREAKMALFRYFGFCEYLCCSLCDFVVLVWSTWETCLVAGTRKGNYEWALILYLRLLGIVQ